MGVPSWALDPYVLLNSAVCLSYAIVRFYISENSQLFKADPMGFTREMQVLVMLAVSSYTKYRRSNSIPEFLPTLYLHCKIGILVCSYVADGRLAGWYAVIFLGLSQIKSVDHM